MSLKNKATASGLPPYLFLIHTRQTSMKLIYDNISAILRPAVIKDIADVTQLALAAGANVPSCSLRIIALDENGVPDSLPEHQLTVPPQTAPAALAARCDWQVLRDSFQIITKSNPTKNTSLASEKLHEESQTIWIIAGSSTGAMYGVNEMLSATTGVIFAGQNDEDVLFGPTYSLPLNPQRPRFAYRGFYGSDRHWAARHKLNFAMAGAAYFTTLQNNQRESIEHDAQARSIVRTRSEHAMELFLPSDLLKQNKAWQGMRDGQRCMHDHVVMPDCPSLNAWLPVQPCYSNAQLRKVIVENMAALCEQSPRPDFFGVWPHDGVNNWCQCDDCVQLTPFEHMHRLALELREYLPQDSSTCFDLIVYSNMLNLPRQVLTENDRAMAFFCPYLRPFRHGVFDEGGPQQVVTGTAYPEPDRINPVDEREYGKLFHQWLTHWKQAKITPALFEYPGHFIDETGQTDLQRYGHAPTADIRENEAIEYARLGLRIAILCGQPGSWPDAFPDLVWAQTLWGNERVAKLRHRYYTAVAGEHGDRLADAIDGVIMALKHSIEVPFQAMAKLKNVLEQLPASKHKTAYTDWLYLILIGRESFSHRLAGNFETTATKEKTFRAYVEQHAHRIASAKQLIHYSKLFQDRAAQIHSNQKSMQYTL